MANVPVTGRQLGPHGSVNFARGPSITDRGSVFTAHVAWPMRSVAAAHAALAVMKQDSSCSTADHAMTAYRVSVPPRGAVEKAYDDDGEAHGGQRLLGALTKMKAVNVAVCVSRVYGGQNIGKARFEHMCAAPPTRRRDPSCRR